MPIGVLGIVLVSLFIPDLREERPPPLDLRGFLLSAVGLLGLVFGFETHRARPRAAGAPRCCSWRPAPSRLVLYVLPRQRARSTR